MTSQRNFDYLEASVRDLILAELDWKVQDPTNAYQLLQSMAVIGTVKKKNLFEL